MRLVFSSEYNNSITLSSRIAFSTRRSPSTQTGVQSAFFFFWTTTTSFIHPPHRLCKYFVCSKFEQQLSGWREVVYIPVFRRWWSKFQDSEYFTIRGFYYGANTSFSTASMWKPQPCSSEFLEDSKHSSRLQFGCWNFIILGYYLWKHQGKFGRLWRSWRG